MKKGEANWEDLLRKFLLIALFIILLVAVYFLFKRLME